MCTYILWLCQLMHTVEWVLSASELAQNVQVNS